MLEKLKARKAMYEETEANLVAELEKVRSKIDLYNKVIEAESPVVEPVAPVPPSTPVHRTNGNGFVI
jgi:hypothetical protein